MKLEILNGSLIGVAEYLPKLQLKGRGNRARQRLLKAVTEKLKIYFSDIEDLKLDETDSEEEKEKKFVELNEENCVIDMTEYAGFMVTLSNLMQDYDYVISTEKNNGMPSDSIIHDYIIDVLEEAIEKDREKQLEENNVIQFEREEVNGNQ